MNNQHELSSVSRSQEKNLPDHGYHADVAKGWNRYIGSRKARTDKYRGWLCEMLRSTGCVAVLDAACGTGIDSVMLVEEGFQVHSVDASNEMLQFATRERWERRHEPGFDSWVIEQANWLTLHEDLQKIPNKPPGGYDALVCIGNSFPHLPYSEGYEDQKLVLRNFKEMLKTGGVLFIDHRNYDNILNTGLPPTKTNTYYNNENVRVTKATNTYINGVPSKVQLEYRLFDEAVLNGRTGLDVRDAPYKEQWYMECCPQRVVPFGDMLKGIFGESAPYQVHGDFKPLNSGDDPINYMHVIQKV